MHESMTVRIPLAHLPSYHTLRVQPGPSASYSLLGPEVMSDLARGPALPRTFHFRHAADWARWGDVHGGMEREPSL